MSLYKTTIDKYEIEYRNKHKIPDKTYSINCIDFSGYCEYEKMISRMWISENKINLVSIDNCSDKNKITIDIDDIVLYKRIGDLHSYSDVTGGGNNGSSIKGAIVGGVLAGGAGAVIGSRTKTNEIKTKMKTVDNRTTFLEVNKNGNNYLLKFKSEDYNVFLKLIPNKEEGYVKNNSNSSSEDVYSQLGKLASLKTSGILTEQEFNEKKTILLNKIK